jgi:hypothetical protein
MEKVMYNVIMTNYEDLLVCTFAIHNEHSASDSYDKMYMYSAYVVLQCIIARLQLSVVFTTLAL